MLINLGVRNAGVFAVATVANAMECCAKRMNERTNEQTGIIYRIKYTESNTILQQTQQTTHHLHIEIGEGGVV